MGNWSVVILTWSEKLVDPRLILTGASHAINPDNHQDIDWRLTPGLSDVGVDTEDIPGQAFATVAVTHINGFMPESLLAALALAPFENPDAVEILWKDENSEMFRRERLRTYLDRKAAPRSEYEPTAGSASVTALHPGAAPRIVGPSDGFGKIVVPSFGRKPS